MTNTNFPKRTIAHLDLDAFFVSCEQLVNPSLQKLPLIIGGKSDRAVVASCSYEARKFGVRSAMPIYHALRLCPQAKVVKGDMDLYKRKSKEVTQVLQEESPLLEKASIDEFYLDMTGMDRYFGCYKWTNELSDKVTKETGLPISFGLSVNKTVSKIATGEGKPMGRKNVPAQEVQPFLNPLSIRKIPQVGDKTYQLLSRMGIRQIKTLAEMPKESMMQLMGKNGLSLWKKANGIDNRAVVPYSEQKSISTESTFHQDTIDIDFLESILMEMVEDLGYQLRKQERCCSVISVKIRYSNFDTHTKQMKIPVTNLDHYMLPVVKELFRKVYQRRMLIRLVGVKCDGLVNSGHQLNLFNDDEKTTNLYQALDKIKSKYGNKAITKSTSLKNCT